MRKAQKKIAVNTTQQSSNFLTKLLFNYSIKKQFSQILEELEVYKNELERINSK